MWTLLRGDDVFFDIGANRGCISLHAATFSEFQGEIHSFEPVPETFADLDSLVQQAQLNDRIHCHQVALSNRSGVGTMILPDPAQSGWAKISGDGLGFQVPFTRLDDMDLPNPKFLKIDVEGHELEVLKGAETTLRRSKAFIVFESWLLPQNPGKTAAPWQFLADLGYVFFCPAWRSKDDTSLITVSNMPTGKNREFQLVLIPCELEHRMFGPEQWSYLACHGDRCEELARALTITP